jgi:hypothetical protein
MGKMEKCILYFGWKTDHSEDLGVGGIILEWISGTGVEWIHVAPDRDQWQDLANTVMNLWVPQKAENFLIS